MDKRFKVIGFVDWNTAIIASGASRTGGRADQHAGVNQRVRQRQAERAAQTALQHTEGVLSDYLVGLPGRSRFRVQLRLYAGWWAGKTRTDYRIGIEKLRLSYACKQRSYMNQRVVFQAGDEGIQLSDRLACVNSNKRLAPKERVHFLDTVRSRDGNKREKMVDTALVTDLVGLVHSSMADRYVVVSDDDDVLAGLIYSESLNPNVKMLSRPKASSKYMAHTEGMIHTYEMMVVSR